MHNFVIVFRNTFWTPLPSTYAGVFMVFICVYVLAHKISFNHFGFNNYKNISLRSEDNYF